MLYNAYLTRLYQFLCKTSPINDRQIPLTPVFLSVLSIARETTHLKFVIRDYTLILFWDGYIFKVASSPLLELKFRPFQTIYKV